MRELIKIYKFDSRSILQQNFYNMTKLNPTYNGRKLFLKRNKYIENNKHFPLDFVKSALNINGLYLFACENPGEYQIDSDFDLGFNNLSFNFEEELLDVLCNKYTKTYLIVKVMNHNNNFNIIRKIEREYKIFLLSNKVQNLYLIEFEEREQLSFLNRYIQGYLFQTENNSNYFHEKSFNIDLKYISEIISNGNTLIYRVPIFSNYNLMIYSMDLRTCNCISMQIEKFISENIELSYIQDPISIQSIFNE